MAYQIPERDIQEMVPIEHIGMPQLSIKATGVPSAFSISSDCDIAKAVGSGANDALGNARTRASASIDMSRAPKSLRGVEPGDGKPRMRKPRPKIEEDEAKYNSMTRTELACSSQLTVAKSTNPISSLWTGLKSSILSYATFVKGTDPADSKGSHNKTNFTTDEPRQRFGYADIVLFVGNDKMDRTVAALDTQANGKLNLVR